MTIARRIARRPLVAAVGLLVTATCISGCEPSKDFSITNATDQTLTIDRRFEYPGQTPAPTSGPGDVTLTLAPGERTGVQLGLEKGDCLNITFLAHDQAGHLLYSDPAPICRDKNGHGNTWLIKKK